MLKLARRCGESLHIFPAEGLDPRTTVADLFAHRPVTVVVSELRGTRAWLGIAAPKALAIARDELFNGNDCEA